MKPLKEVQIDCFVGLRYEGALYIFGEPFKADRVCADDRLPVDWEEA